MPRRSRRSDLSGGSSDEAAPRGLQHPPHGPGIRAVPSLPALLLCHPMLTTGDFRVLTRKPRGRSREGVYVSHLANRVAICHRLYPAWGRPAKAPSIYKSQLVYIRTL